MSYHKIVLYMLMRCEGVWHVESKVQRSSLLTQSYRAYCDDTRTMYHLTTGIFWFDWSQNTVDTHEKHVRQAARKHLREEHVQAYANHAAGLDSARTDVFAKKMSMAKFSGQERTAVVAIF